MTADHRRPPLPAATLPCILLALTLGGCGNRDTATGPGTGTAAADVPPTAHPAVLQDVARRTPSQIVGISYDPALQPSPALASVLAAHAEQAQNELHQALEELGNDSPRVPYELSLHFQQTVSTPVLQAVSADGSLYTGGAHGMPLVTRFVWLVEQDRQLTAAELVPQAASRQAVADHVEQVLLAKMEDRLREEGMPQTLHAEALESARGMIADGTEPSVGNFSQFEPVVDAAGRIVAIRFIFPPYQVGPYSDGIQSVEVPAAFMLPHVAPAYATLFSTAGQ